MKKFAQSRYSSIKFASCPAIKQSGGTLVIALVMLLAMTIFAVANMQSSTMQERMASNNRQRSVAKYSAESALKLAEKWLDTNVRSLSALGQFDGADGLYSMVRVAANQAPAPSTNDIKDVTVADDWNNTTAYLGNDKIMDTELVSRQPQYIIEYIGRDYRGASSKIINTDDLSTVVDSTVSKPFFFRVTAIGWGKDAKVYTVLESIYRTGSSDFFNY